MYYCGRLLSASILLGISPVSFFLFYCRGVSVIIIAPCLLILQFMDSRLVSNFLLLWITLLWTFLYCPLDAASHPQAVSVSPYKMDSPGFMWRTMSFWSSNKFKFQTLFGLDQLVDCSFFSLSLRAQMERIFFFKREIMTLVIFWSVNALFTSNTCNSRRKKLKELLYNLLLLP